MTINNENFLKYKFLKDMSLDDSFPRFLVDKGKKIFVDLCEGIEEHFPKNNDELFKLTHAATEAFNDLQEEFEDHNCDIETIAVDGIVEGFSKIVEAYGFDVEIDDVIAPRDW